MFSSRSSWSMLSKALPSPRRLRVARSAHPHRWNMRRAAIGMELRGTSLYLACVRPGANHRWVSSTGVIPDLSQLNPEALRGKFRELLGSVVLEEPVCVLGLPRRDVMVRHLPLPLAAQKSLDSVLSLQLGLYKPSDDEEFCSDAAVVRNGEQLAVSLMFLPRARVEDVAAKLREAGLPVARMTTAQFSTIDWLLRGAQQDASRRVLVQEHGSEVELALIDSGACVMTRSVRVNAAGDAATQVAAEIRRMLAAHRGSAPITVILAGAATSAWREALGEFGEVQDLATVCDAYSLRESAAPDADPDEFWGAIALALQGLSWTGDYRLNLLPRELRPTRRRWQAAPTFALLALNVVLLTALAGRGPLQRHVQLRRFRYEISRIDRNASLVERQVQKERKIEERLAALQAFQQTGRRPLDALSELAQKLPPDAYVAAYTCRQGQVDIMGVAKSASSVLPALKASPEFADVQFAGGLTRDGEGGERFRIQMKLRAAQ